MTTFYCGFPKTLFHMYTLQQWGQHFTFQSQVSQKVKELNSQFKTWIKLLNCMKMGWSLFIEWVWKEMKIRKPIKSTKSFDISMFLLSFQLLMIWCFLAGVMTSLKLRVKKILFTSVSTFLIHMKTRFHSLKI